MSSQKIFSIENITSNDGTMIGFRRIGMGPSLVIVPGTARTSAHYIRLAESLADQFTVYIMDRRGRGNSGPQSTNYSLKKEQEDVTAVLKKAQATFLFGHSYGGLVALDVALEYPLLKLAIYEPGVSINDSLPIIWISDYEDALVQKNYCEAHKIFLKAMGVDIPDEQLEEIIQAMSQSPEWEETVMLMPTIANEFKEAHRVDSTFEKYKGIEAETLMLTGTLGTDDFIFFNKMATQALESVIPNLNTLTLQDLDHNAPDIHAPDQVAQVLKDFFL
jgi:pimeloyl-ACP methyl ester carboxylesterase